MLFYTSVDKVKNRIYARGYSESGPVTDICEYSPVLYAETAQETDFRTIDDIPVRPKVCDDIRHMQKLAASGLHGNANPVTQYIHDRFARDMTYDRERMRIAVFDIETKSDEGFPHPDQADQPVLSIAGTLGDLPDEVFVFGCGEYSMREYDGRRVRYFRCRDETDLLRRFIVEYWVRDGRHIDLITGWNTRFYDVPYLVNRMMKLDIGVSVLSPWGVVKPRRVTIFNREQGYCDIIGIQHVDYIDLFKKFGYAYMPQESMRLGDVAENTIGEKKMSIEDSSDLFRLLISSKGVGYDKNKPNEELSEFKRWCKQRDRIKEEMMRRGIIHE